jgi:hypothetical protein
VTANIRRTAVLLAVLVLVVGCGRKEAGGPVGLNQKEREFVRERLAGMRDNVELVSFTGEGCKTCDDTEALFDAIASVQPKVVRATHDLEDPAAASLGVTLAPVVILKKGDLTRLRYFGTPSGYEFSPFVETIDRLSRGEVNVSAASVKALAALKAPVTMKIFVTPS